MAESKEEAQERLLKEGFTQDEDEECPDCHEKLYVKEVKTWCGPDTLLVCICGYNDVDHYDTHDLE